MAEKTEYNPRAIEPKWRAWWESHDTDRALDDDPRPKYYCLDMFPYPSGEGLHVGHWRGYVISDVRARYMRLRGHNVMHPMGWDAFGLPAENFAIKNKLHPATSVAQNIANMKRQLAEMGAMFDWSREFATCDPEYYRWTQWIFLQMYRRGLAYRRVQPVNWCPSCQVGLANEEVVGGECERCGTPVTKRDIEQWFLRITVYAERLLADLAGLDWPERVKTMQANWIGRSEGATVVFDARRASDGTIIPVPIFTTRPDTLFGATYMVLAPEHPLVAELTAESRRAEVERYVAEARQTKEIDRTATTREKTGVALGAYALNPVNGRDIPIWIADYVLMGYGTGAIMAVPAHDERDFAFAQTFGLPIVEVIHGDGAARDASGALAEAYIGPGAMIDSGPYDGMANDDGKRAIVADLEKEKRGEATVTYRLRDWLFSRQRYWGEPIPIVYCDTCGEQPLPEDSLPLLLPEVESYAPTGTGKSPLAAISEWVNTTCPKCGGHAVRETDTMPQWAGSCWYFLRFASPHDDKAAFDPTAIRAWLPVDMYVGGIEHAVLHLLYARFWTKVLHDAGHLPFDEPFPRLFNQGMIGRMSKSGRVEKMSKSKGNIVNPDAIVAEHGTDSLRIYELFVGPAEQDSEWNDQGIQGISRFLHRSWALVAENIPPRATGTDGETLAHARHALVKQVTEGLEAFRFNTLVSRMMEFVNLVTSAEGTDGRLDRETRDTYIALLAPFAPHMAEELWSLAGNGSSIFDKAGWPAWDEALAAARTVTVAVQVNGKLRATVEMPADSAEEDMKTLALAQPNVQKYTDGKPARRVIVVPNRLVNIVV